MKIGCTLLVATFLTAVSLFGQGFETSAKLYTNINYFGSTPVPSLFEWEERFIRFRGFTPAVHFYNDEKWVYHEVEFSNLNFRKTEQQLQDVQEFLIGIRYEYGRVLDIDLGEGLQLLLGGAARTFYYRQSITPKVSNRFDELYQEFKVVLGVVPSIKYRINEQFSIHLNTVISPFVIGMERRFFDNPTLFDATTTQSNFNTDFLFFGDLTFRLGVAYHL
ncbi:MAG: hypothetical protein AAGI49_15835 [Bacteroidota bacterium]